MWKCIKTLSGHEEGEESQVGLSLPDRQTEVES